MRKFLSFVFLLVLAPCSPAQDADAQLLQALKSYRKGEVKQAGVTFHKLALQGKHKHLATMGLRIVRGDFGASEFTLSHCLLQEAALHGGLREKRILIDFYLYQTNPFNNAQQALVWKKFLANKGDQEAIQEFKQAKKSGKLSIGPLESAAVQLEKIIVSHLNDKKNIQFCHRPE